MTFTFTNVVGTPLVRSPFANLIGNLMSGVQQGVKTSYMPRMMEADIFHKQISPLAMLASSPFFSSLQPQQQQQIAAYISQMLQKQGISPQQAGMPSGQATGQQQVPGAPQAPQPGQQGTSGIPGQQNLVPGTPAEHFTGKYIQSPYTAGTPHRGEQGQTVYTPTTEAVAKGLKVLNETGGFKKLFDDFTQSAKIVAKGGPVKETASIFGSNVEKATAEIPFVSRLGKRISEVLGGDKIANARAHMQARLAEMVPALNAMDFSDKEINSIFSIMQGESEKNVGDKLKLAWPVIERKIKNYHKNLTKGQTVTEEPTNEFATGIVPNEALNIPKQTPKKEKKINTEHYDIPEGYIGLYNKKNGKLYYFPPDKVEYALTKGFSYE